MNPRSFSTFKEAAEYRRNRFHRRVLHRPTYFFVQTIESDTGKPPTYDRHDLKRFSSRNAVQTDLSVNRMKNALNWLMLFAEKKTIYSKKAFIDKKGNERHNFSFRLGFITLTLTKPQIQSDEYIKSKMLEPFLRWLRRFHACAYVWKAETQLNGNIHFHITIDAFIHYKEVAAKWNMILKRHEYYGSEASTQIKAIRNEQGLGGIIGGYLTKGSIEEKEYDLQTAKKKIADGINMQSGISCNIENKMHYTRFVEGRIWGCVEGLSNINCFLDEKNDSTFIQSESEFFKNNKPQKLSKLLIEEEKKRLGTALQLYAVDYLEDKFRKYENVYIHKHLKFSKVPEAIQSEIHKAKLKAKPNTRKNYTIDSIK